MRLAPREDLASLARVAPLLRAARDLDNWAAQTGSPTSAAELQPAITAVAASALDLAPREITAAWQVLIATRDATMPMPDPSGLADILGSGSTEAVLEVWDTALAVILASEELDGIATALYTVGEPVAIDGLFDAYASAAGAGRAPVADADSPDAPDQGSALSLALETLADLAVVELGTEESDGSLTVSLSPLGTWGVHRRLRAQGWHVPVLGAAARYDAACWRPWRTATLRTARPRSRPGSRPGSQPLPLLS